ncbi:hypothetical protein D3C76_1796190 [compost metagenome]
MVAEGENHRGFSAFAVMLHQLPERLVEGLCACGVILKNVLRLGAYRTADGDGIGVKFVFVAAVVFHGVGEYEVRTG